MSTPQTPLPAPLRRLREAGFDLGTFNEEQLALLGSLDAAEIDVLLDIKERLGDARPEVEAHGRLDEEMPMSIGGLLF